MIKTETIHFNEKDYRELETIAKQLGYKTVDEMTNTAICAFIRNNVIETEEVTVKVPKKLLAVAKVFRSKNLEEYLSNCLTDTIAADVEAEVFGDHICIKEDYDLNSEFRFYEGH